MHKPVLLNEVIENLKPQPGENFIDATANGGGHAKAILEKIRPAGRLVAIEWDPVIYNRLACLDWVRRARLDSAKRAGGLGNNGDVVLVNDSYTNLKNIAIDNGFDINPIGGGAPHSTTNKTLAGRTSNGIDGVIFDFGMSSWHIEQSGKGFSFLRDEPLDMRYDDSGRSGRPTAGDIVNNWYEDELTAILKNFGEESFALPIAKAIIKARRRQTITGTFQLIEVIKNAVPWWYRKKRTHFATKTFQALRITVNRELENIKEGLGQAIEVTKQGGRIGAITFHSLEDRIVKNIFKDSAKNGIVGLLNKKPIRAGDDERISNPSSRSAKLRVVIKN